MTYVHVMREDKSTCNLTEKCKTYTWHEGEFIFDAQYKYKYIDKSIVKHCTKGLSWHMRFADNLVFNSRNCVISKVGGVIFVKHNFAWNNY